MIWFEWTGPQEREREPALERGAGGEKIERKLSTFSDPKFLR